MVIGHKRRFVGDLRSPPMLSFLPMAWHARKLVHGLAHVFKLNSKGEGNGAVRFTRLVKTMFDGVRADERNVARILIKALPHGRGAREREEKGGENEDHPLSRRRKRLNVGLQTLSAM
ncbi:hypothetical protein EDB85DRAFT_2019421 [Lactarius pseudohatsudake]|nr:hypothetical protein EDB85DRAFT_2019421 [Lactarius pseudohatsudake]